MIDIFNADAKQTKLVQMDDRTVDALVRLVDIARDIYRGDKEPVSDEEGAGTVMDDVETLENWINGAKRMKSVRIDKRTLDALVRLAEIVRYIYEDDELASREDGEGSITVMDDVETLGNWISHTKANQPSLLNQVCTARDSICPDHPTATPSAFLGSQILPGSGYLDVDSAQ
jgi:hypothetical protein